MSFSSVCGGVRALILLALGGMALGATGACRPESGAPAGGEAASAVAGAPPPALPRIAPAPEPRDARALIATAAVTKGGADALRGLRAVRTHGHVGDAPPGPQRESIDVLLALPDRVRVERRVGGRPVAGLVLDGERGWSLTPEGATPLAGAALADARAALAADATLLLRAALDPAAELDHLGVAEVEGRPADAVRVAAPGQPPRVLFLDAQTQLPAAIQYDTSAGPVLVREADWRPVGALVVAHESRVFAHGSETVARIDEVTLDPEIPPDAFDPARRPLVPPAAP